MNRSVVASAVLFSFVVAVAVLTGCSAELENAAPGVSETSFALGDPNLRIAVVGAGPSGLTAAHELEKRGYQNVVVFEKDARVGGKVNTLRMGGLSAELGAVFGAHNYELTFALATEYGIPYVEYLTPRQVYDSSIANVPFKKSYQEFLLQHYTLPEIVAATQNYARVLQTYPQIFADSMANLPAALQQNFQTFAEQEGIVPVAEMAKSLVVGFGYGYYDNVPAIYVLKILNMLVKVGPQGLYSAPYYVFPGGFQSLWEAVARDLDVRLNSEVTKIKRSDCGGPIELTVNHTDRQQFDVVIVSAPLSAVPRFVKLSKHEKELFEQVESTRYFVTLFAATNMQGGETTFVHDHATSDKINHVAVWASPGGGSGVFSAYQITDRSVSTESVANTLAADVLAIGGGVLQRVLVQKEWTDYFPRVNAAALAAGFYDQVEALQGQGGLYYVGGTLSFETVETSARYARSLVDASFPATAVVAP